MTNDDLRPTGFDDYIGQAQLKRNLQVFIEASKIRNQPLDHILLAGVSGVGKTTVAHIIANELGSNMISVIGTSLHKPGQFSKLLKLNEGDILFIDEVHGISKAVEDALLLALEEFRIFLPDPEDKSPVDLVLPRFICIGATTEVGMLEKPLRDRFGITGTLDFLTDQEIVAVLSRSAKLIGATIDLDGLCAIAIRSRGTPRVANQLLKRVADFALVEGKRITGPFADGVLTNLGIDATGLTETDKKLLNVLAYQFAGKPAGLGALSAATFESPQTIVEVCEPYLLREQFIIRTAKGRQLTQKAKDYLEVR